jgi:hypothetical protein
VELQGLSTCTPQHNAGTQTQCSTGTELAECLSHYFKHQGL